MVRSAAPTGLTVPATISPINASAAAKRWTCGPHFPYERDANSHGPPASVHMNDISTAVTPAIALSGVNLSLGRGAARVHILKDIDLNIGSGEAIGLVGPSGSGKTTL